MAEVSPKQENGTGELAGEAMRTEEETEHSGRVVKDLIQLIRDIVPLLENVRTSIEESSSHIPKASKQLSNVTQATESATVEILNVVDSMTIRISEAEKSLLNIKQSVDRSNIATGKLLAGIGRLPVEHRDALAAFARAVEQEIADPVHAENFRTAEEFLRKTKEESMSIAISLQVQDITSQQIAGVAQIMESVRGQLSDAMQRFENGTSAGGDVQDHFAGKVVDTNAQYTRSPERQSEADEIVKQFSNGKP
jgi:chemotaxis regulatin CheY-phosphate phosphatase CheZ